MPRFLQYSSASAWNMELEAMAREVRFSSKDFSARFVW